MSVHDAEPALVEPHTPQIEDVLSALKASRHGLSRAEAADRLQRFGPNALPHTRPPSVFRVFLRQFSSPLIYVLLLAALVSMLIQEWSDAALIAAVLLVNAIIGTLTSIALNYRTPILFTRDHHETAEFLYVTAKREHLGSGWWEWLAWPLAPDRSLPGAHRDTA